MAVWCEMKILSLRISVLHHFSSLYSYPHDWIFTPHPTTIKDSYILTYQCIQEWVIPIVTKQQQINFTSLPMQDKHCNIEDKLHETDDVTTLSNLLDDFLCGYGFSYLDQKEHFGTKII